MKSAKGSRRARGDAVGARRGSEADTPERARPRVAPDIQDKATPELKVRRYSVKQPPKNKGKPGELSFVTDRPDHCIRFERTQIRTSATARFGPCNVPILARVLCRSSVLSCRQTPAVSLKVDPETRKAIRAFPGRLDFDAQNLIGIIGCIRPRVEQHCCSVQGSK